VEQTPKTEVVLQTGAFSTFFRFMIICSIYRALLTHDVTISFSYT